MSILFIILLIIATLVSLILVVPLFIKNDYAIEREITINKPKQEVFNYIKYIRNQEYYNKWVMMDPDSKKEYRGTDGAVGFVASWDSKNKNVGKGEQEITNLIEGEKMNLELRFEKPFKGLATAEMITETVDSDQTKVKWSFKSRMNYPMNIMLLVMNMEDMLGKDLQTGLTNLKTVLEKE